MIVIYLVISAILILVGNSLFDILRQGWSWWATPLIFIGLFLLLVIIHSLLFVVITAMMNINSPVEKGSRAYRKFVNATISLWFKLGFVEFRVGGLEKLPQNTRFFLVCNHQHDFDPAVIMNILNGFEIGFIGKKEIFSDMPFVAKAMHKLYGLPIDRENNREAVKTIIAASKIIKEDKASMALFPEGYTSKDCELLPFRNGAFKIAYKSNAPIVVCVLNNTQSIVKNIFRRKTIVDFKVLEVIGTEDYKELTTVQLGDRLYEQMNAVIKELRK